MTNIGLANEVLLYDIFHEYLKESGYNSDQDPDDYWEDLEDVLLMTFQQVIDEYDEEE